MDYYCEACDIFIKPESNKKHFISNTHKEFDKCKHIKLTMKNPNTNDVDEIFHAYIIEHNRKHDYYLVKCEFKLVFNDNQYCPYVSFILHSSKTMCFWQIFLGNAIDDLKKKDIISII